MSEESLKSASLSEQEVRPGRLRRPLTPYCSDLLETESESSLEEEELEEEDSSEPEKEEEYGSLLSVLTSSSMEVLCPRYHPPPSLDSRPPTAHPLERDTNSPQSSSTDAITPLRLHRRQANVQDLTKQMEEMQVCLSSKPPVHRLGLLPTGRCNPAPPHPLSKADRHQGRILHTTTPVSAGHLLPSYPDTPEDDRVSMSDFLMDSTPLPGAVAHDSSVVPRVSTTVCRRLILDMETMDKFPSTTSRVKNALKLGTGSSTSHTTVTERPQTAATMDGVQEDGYEYLHPNGNTGLVWDPEANSYSDIIDVSQCISSFPSFNRGVLEQYQEDLQETEGILPRHHYTAAKVDRLAQQGMNNWQMMHMQRLIT